MYTIVFTSKRVAVVVSEDQKSQVPDGILEGNRKFETFAQAVEYAGTFDVESVEAFTAPEVAEISGTPYPERSYRYGKRLVVHNLVERALFENEICGQISDGAWENTQPYNHWEPWAEAQVLVDPTGRNVGRDFYARKDNYRLSSLVEVVGDRMKFYAELAMQFPTEIQACLQHEVRLPDSLQDFDREVESSAKYQSSANKVATWLACGLTREKVEVTENNMLITDKDLRGYLRELSACMKTYNRGV